MNIPDLIEKWIAACNSFETKKYLSFYAKDAVLDDPSVGKKFDGVKGIEEYFVTYFIGYQTQVKKKRLLVKNENNAWLEVEFTGTFPEGKIDGTFDFTFKNGKIIFVTADLV